MNNELTTKSKRKLGISKNLTYVLLSIAFIICSIILWWAIVDNPYSSWGKWIMFAQYTIAFFFTPVFLLTGRLNWKSALIFFFLVMFVGDLSQSIAYYVLSNNNKMGSLRLGFAIIDIVMLPITLWVINYLINWWGGDSSKHKGKWNLRKKKGRGN